MTMRTVIDNTNRKTTTTDLEIFGMRLGHQCAQRILRGYGDNPNVPDESVMAVRLHFQRLVNDYVVSERVTNGMTDGGEAAYRKGFDRGLQSQMKNPTAKIEIKVI